MGPAMNNSYLWIDDSGASDAEIRRGVAAALEVFDRLGLSADHCYRQVAALAEGDAYGERGVNAWREAEAAAIVACCAGWWRVPVAAHLVLECAT